ncbi:MAG: septum site-determining protein MinC [Cardiobacteriaceae bacterium]|nr:septum site-determining protein MinC [Cardiobacteriaceae bacterium]
MRDTLVFKTRNHPITIVTLPSTELAAIDALLSAKMADAPAGFFTASPFVADFGAQAPGDAHWLQTLKALFARHGLTLIGIQAETLSDPLLAEAGLAHIAGSAGKAPAMPDPAPKAPTKPAPEPPPPPAAAAKRTMVVRRHVRSGQRLYAEGTDLVIIGTVGAGAEVIADGNIYIFGQLRGRAFAGAHGDENAFIYAAELEAELVSVAGQYQNMEQLEPYRKHKSMLIRLGQNDTMQIAAVL